MLQFDGNRVQQNKTRDQAHCAETPHTSSICFKCVQGAKKLHLLTHLHGCATAIPRDMDPDTKPSDGTGWQKGRSGPSHLQDRGLSAGCGARPPPLSSQQQRKTPVMVAGGRSRDGREADGAGQEAAC